MNTLSNGTLEQVEIDGPPLRSTSLMPLSLMLEGPTGQPLGGQLLPMTGLDTDVIVPNPHPTRLAKNCLGSKRVDYVSSLTLKCTVCLIARTPPLPWFAGKLSKNRVLPMVRSSLVAHLTF